MRALLALILLLPALALAEPTHAEWSQATGERVQLTFTDGSTLVGTVVAVEDDQARIRKDDGSITTVPTMVVDAITPPEGATPRTAERTPPPPEPVPQPPPRTGPRVGVGVGVGVGGAAGGVSIGTGTVTGPRTSGVPAATGRRDWELVGVRYPMRGRETIDWMFLSDRGAFRPYPDDLLRPRALREYVFVDQWGRSIPWQSAWAAMGAERDYILKVKKIDNTMVPLRATEAALGLGGIGLMIYTYVISVNDNVNPYTKPGWIGGSAMVLGNIAFNLGVTGPTRNRLRVQLGRDGLSRAESYFRER